MRVQLGGPAPGDHALTAPQPGDRVVERQDVEEVGVGQVEDDRADDEWRDRRWLGRAGVQRSAPEGRLLDTRHTVLARRTPSVIAADMARVTPEGAAPLAASYAARGRHDGCVAQDAR